MNLFSFIVGPALAALLTDTQCLYYVFVAQPDVTASYSVSVPEVSISVNTDLNEVYISFFKAIISQSVSLSPSWSSSYLCSSAILRHFTPVLIFSYIMSGVVVPLLAVVAGLFVTDEMKLLSSESPYLSYFSVIEDVEVGSDCDLLVISDLIGPSVSGRIAGNNKTKRNMFISYYSILTIF